MNHYYSTKNVVIKELQEALSLVSDIDVLNFINAIESSEKVFFVGVGRVLLSLKAIAKRLAHLGVQTVIVGQITEPAITSKDLLIVGSGSGETLFPLGIAKKAKNFNAKVAHIGSSDSSSMEQYRDIFIRIPVGNKLSSGTGVSSEQPMNSLFEQSLLLLGDIISLMIVRKNSINIHDLWKCHANLE